jgi:hypothetical protein
VGEQSGKKWKSVHLHGIQLLLLRNNLIDVRRQARICRCELCAERALDGGLDFGLRAWGDTVAALELIFVDTIIYGAITLF